MAFDPNQEIKKNISVLLEIRHALGQWCGMADGGPSAAVVRVLFFGGAKDACGREGTEVPWRAGMRLGDVLEAMVGAHPGLGALRGHIRLARNGEFAALSEPVAAGDEVAVIPPVSGG